MGGEKVRIFCVKRFRIFRFFAKRLGNFEKVRGNGALFCVGLVKGTYSHYLLGV